MKKLKNIKNYLDAKYQKIIKDPVKISLSVAVLVSCLILSISFIKNDYNGSFLEGVRVEAHGMLFDLWIIGVFVLFLNEIARKHSENQKYQDEIDDFRDWESEEAQHRIVGNIKRLNRNNISNIDLHKCFLYLTNLRKINLKGANLARANLVGVNLQETNLRDTNLYRVNLKGAHNLTIKQLSNVKTLYLAKLDSKLMAEVKDKYPHLLEKPK